jgi:uncharacterized protein (TIGR00251 family)
MRLSIKVVPKASRDRVAGWMGEVLKVCVTAPPERGKANAAVVEVLAEALGVPRAAVRIVAGETSPRKTIEVAGVGEEVALRRLGRSAPGAETSATQGNRR